MLPQATVRSREGSAALGLVHHSVREHGDQQGARVAERVGRWVTHGRPVVTRRPGWVPSRVPSRTPRAVQNAPD